MNIYIDESGSINNKLPSNACFVIAMIYATDKSKLERSYKRFVSKYHEKLKALDTESKMFLNGKFKELKGSCFDYEMKCLFLEFFSKPSGFEVYYIHVNNAKLSDQICSNTSRAFNFFLKNALQYFFQNNYLPQEECNLQLDERNESTKSKHFLCDYLNTELLLNGITEAPFKVTYFDSSNNKYIQIADVFSNIYYSELLRQNYTSKLEQLSAAGILRKIYKFPLH